MKKIEFTHQGHSHAFGSFSIGDCAVVPEALAHHFVLEALCARYVEPGQPADAAPDTDLSGPAAGIAGQKPGQKAQRAKPAAQGV